MPPPPMAVPTRSDEKKTGRQLDRSHRPARGGMNETNMEIDPVSAVMFKTN